MTGPPDPGPRFEDTHGDLPIGTLCHTEWRGATHAYLFLGWRSTTVGRSAIFARVQTGERVYDGWLIHDVGLIYYATHTPTILQKFPDLPPAAPTIPQEALCDLCAHPLPQCTCTDDDRGY